tara:strand:+ start:243 stop:1259 length:1017 start_codon:yes stop_codon:yes gene_type:complete
MANYSGREFKVIMGITDIDGTNGDIGDPQNDERFESNSNIDFRVVPPVSDIDFTAGMQRSEIVRAGRRTLAAEDIIQHNGSGSYTWDFSYVADNEMACQNLLNLIYPGDGSVTGDLAIPAAPTVLSYAHGAATGNNRTAVIIISNPEADEDRIMYSSILQNLTISMDMGTDAGIAQLSGQFMSGYKPLIETNTVSAVTTNSDWQYGLFDCTTITIGGSAVTCKSFSLTIDNPAQRVGFQGSSGECDGYVRAGSLSVTGTMSVKLDSTTLDVLTAIYQANAVTPITCGDGGTNISFSLTKCNISGFSPDLADEGAFVEITFTATSGPDASADLATIVMS